MSYEGAAQGLRIYDQEMGIHTASHWFKKGVYMFIYDFDIYMTPTWQWDDYYLREIHD